MLSAPTDINAYRHDKDIQLLRKYTAKCYTVFVFFATAYREYYGCIDRYQIQCGLEQYERSSEIPDYVLAYLRRLQ